CNARERDLVPRLRSLLVEALDLRGSGVGSERCVREGYGAARRESRYGAARRESRYGAARRESRYGAARRESRYGATCAICLARLRRRRAASDSFLRRLTDGFM